MCLHTILLDPSEPGRMFIAISAAGAFRSDDAGTTWRPINRGLMSEQIPNPTAEVGHCVHRIAMHRSRPGVLFMQKHWDVMRSDDARRVVAGGERQPADRLRVPDRRARARAGDDLRRARSRATPSTTRPDGKLRVYRSRTGGNEWEALTNGLPQRDCYVNVLRDAMAVDTLEPCGVYFGTTGGQVYAVAGCRGSLGAHRPRSPRRGVGRGPDAAVIRVVLPAHLRTLARVDGEVTLDVDGPATQRAVLDALEARYPMLRGTIRDHATQQRRAFVRFFACEEDLSHEPPDARLPDAVAAGAEPFLVVGAMAGG